MSKKALNVQDDSRRKGIQGNTSKSEIKCVCLNARSIINKKTELNIMVDDIKPHIIGITESWANNDITNAELGLEGYVMFRKDRIGRRGGGVLLYIKDTIPAWLGQLIVTPEVVASKINNMKENKSPGVDGLSPKILKETVEQISKPLAHVFNMSLQEGIVPLEWKEPNIIPLFKKGSRNKSVNYRPVSLISVICKLLETIIRDHMIDFLVKHKLINPSQHGFLKARSCLTNLFFCC